MATTRSAFSLFELLVVIGIILTFLGLTLGAVMKTPRVNAAVGTQQLVADVLRQATHTARSTGTPVVIEIYHDSSDILGISQVPIGRESFENLAPGSTASDALSPASSDPAGFTGRGLRIPDCSASATGVPVTLTGVNPHQQDLYRLSTNGHIEGFYLSCAVRPPVPQRIGGGLYPNNILLFEVNSTDISSSGTPAATAGIQLLTRTYTVQPPPSPPSPDTNAANHLPDPPATVEQLTYDLQGWVNTDLGLATVDTQTAADNNDPAGPLAGGMWMQVGLLFDGTNLELFVDNRLCNGGQILATTPNHLIDGPQDNQIAVGAYNASPATDTDPATTQPVKDEIAVVEGSDDGSQQPWAKWRVTTGTIDEMRLDRLGVERAGRLPSGVAAGGNYRITMLPDGQVEFPAGPTMTFSTPSLGTVTITVAGDGVVTSSVTP